MDINNLYTKSTGDIDEIEITDDLDETINFPSNQSLHQGTSNGTLYSDYIMAEHSGYELIGIIGSPTAMRFAYPPMYKEAKDGSLRYWQIGFQYVDQLAGNLVMRHGQVVTPTGKRGVITENMTAVHLNTRSLNIIEQGKVDALGRYNDMYTSKGYRTVSEQSSKIVQGMKGEKYTGQKIANPPMLLQPKLDGIRYFIERKGDKLLCTTYNNKEYTHINHIDREMLDFFYYLPEGARTDGELYCENLIFNQIASAVRTVKTVHPALKYIKYYMFDIIYDANPPYEHRLGALTSALTEHRKKYPEETSNIRIVSGYYAYNPCQIEQGLEFCLSMGYEGIILRKLANMYREGVNYEQSRYRAGRCSNFYKYKKTVDEEATVQGVQDCAGNEKGCASLVVIDPRGNILNVRPRGSFETRRKWLLYPNLIVGKKVTIRFQELSPDGIPRFPVVVEVRDYE